MPVLSRRRFSGRNTKTKPKHEHRLHAAVEALEMRAYLSAAASFEFGSSFAASYAPSGVMQLAELTSSGHEDLISVATKTSGSNFGSVVVQLGNGNGTFASPTSYPLSGAGKGNSDLVSLAVMDVNGDGFPDLIVTECPTAIGSQGTVNVLLNNGNGTFSPAEVYSGVGLSTDAVAVAKFNGSEDIAVANSGDDTVRILLGNGSGQFTLGPAIAVGTAPTSLAAGDFNGDGKIDLAVANEVDGTISILSGAGNGTFTSTFNINAPGVTQVVAADINGDGKMDLVSDYSGVSVFLNTTPGGGALSFASPVNSPGLNFGALAQPGGAGPFEMVTANPRNNTVAVGVANANGTFSGPFTFSTVTNLAGYSPDGAALADVNGDGHPDLVIAAKNSFVVLSGDANGSFQAPQSQNVGQVNQGSYPTAVAIDDLNGDGKNDIVSTYYGAAGNGGIDVLLNNGNGTFKAPLVIQDNEGPVGVAVADFDGDGNMDLVVANKKNGTVSVFFGNGDGTFTAPSIYSAGAGPSAVAVGKFNGFNDIVVSDGGTDTVTVLMGSGSRAGAFPTSKALTVGNGPSDVVVADFKGLAPGIAVTNARDNSITILQETVLGSGTFTSPGQTLAVGNNPTSLVEARLLQNSALPDLVVLNAADGSLTELQATNTGVFSVFKTTNDSLQTSGIQSNAVGLAVGDVDQNKTPDVVLTYELQGSSHKNLAVFLNDGSGNLTRSTEYAVDGLLPALNGTLAAAPISVAIGNLNGDGLNDLAILSAAGSNYSGSITVLLNNSPPLPAFSSIGAANFVVGTAKTFTVITSGSPTAALTESGALPSGLTFVDNGNGTATLAGTAAAGSGGPYTLILTATNSDGGVATQSFQITVDEAPAITSGTAATFTTSTSNDFTVFTTGFPSPALQETGALPNGVSFFDNGDGTADLVGAPAANVHGTFKLTFTAANSFTPNATQVFTLLVFQQPAITSKASVDFVTNTPNTFTVTASGVPSAVLTETGALPAGMTFTDHGNGAATIAGTPTSSSQGTYLLHLEANNGSQVTVFQQFTLSVALSEAPRITGEAPRFVGVKTTTFTVGTPGQAIITALGFLPPTMTFTGVLPTGVSFVDDQDTIDGANTTATLTGTPAVGTGGVYPITITANNGVGHPATEVFTLTVDEAPTITSADTTTATAGTAGTFTITATGYPAPSLSILTSAGALPPGLRLINKGHGTATIAGKPAANTGGIYDLFLVANNGVPDTGTQTFTLTVNQLTAAKFLSADHAAFSLGIPGQFTVQTSGLPRTLTEIGLPVGLQITDNGNNTATLFGEPAAGTYVFTLSASTGVGGVTTQVFTLTVE